MQNFCVNCEHRPARSHKSLCHVCQREQREQDKTLDVQAHREFKIESRELAQTAGTR